MIRPQQLPRGWYPGTSEKIDQLFATWEQSRVGNGGSAPSIVAPHAGWSFSGATAYRAIRSLAPAATIVVVGGHLSDTAQVILFPEEGYETPHGVISQDSRLAKVLKDSMQVSEDSRADNSVDVWLPMVAALYPDAATVCLRAPANDRAILLGRFLAEYAESHDTSMAVVGSTDLTHYGPTFAFAPGGGGAGGVRWAWENDRQFLDLCADMEAEQVIDHARAHRSACSPGAAAAALSFAQSLGIDHGTILEHTSSYEIRPADSFVGYGSILYR